MAGQLRDGAFPVPDSADFSNRSTSARSLAAGVGSAERIKHTPRTTLQPSGRSRVVTERYAAARAAVSHQGSDVGGGIALCGVPCPRKHPKAGVGDLREKTHCLAGGDEVGRALRQEHGAFNLVELDCNVGRDRPPEQTPKVRGTEPVSERVGFFASRFPWSRAQAGKERQTSTTTLGDGGEERTQHAHRNAGQGHGRELTDAFRWDAQSRWRDGNDGAGAAAPGELQGESGAERIAEHVHSFQSSGVEVCFQRVRECRHGGPHVERVSLPLTRQVDGEHIETLRQQRQDAIEILACRPEAVEEQQGFPGAVRVKGSRSWVGGMHRP